MGITDKKNLMPELKVSLDRRCEGCVHFNGRDWCKSRKHATKAINYGCDNWITQERLDAELAKVQAFFESKDAIRVNYMLTLMFAFISAAYHIMGRSEAILGELIGGKQWRHERKKALKDIMAMIERISNLYCTYFEKDYVAMMSDYGRAEFDDNAYDGFQMYSGDIVMLGLTVMEHCYHNNAILHEIIDEIRKKPNDLNLFTPEFVSQFKIESYDKKGNS